VLRHADHRWKQSGDAPDSPTALQSGELFVRAPRRAGPTVLAPLFAFPLRLGVVAFRVLIGALGQQLSSYSGRDR
jgi:hypothetical protein